MKKSLLIAILLVFAVSMFSLDLNQKLPLDPSVKIGKLKNGLTYYIKKNDSPEKRAELRLVVNAGSILEDEDQQGLAHFCEHMAFNGTKNFKKSAMTDYLSSIGMGFASGLNAYTSFDETVYMLKSSTDDKAQYEKAVFILSEWAHNLSFEDEEIDKERGVIIEEWRGGRGADERMSNESRKVILQGSKYADRSPIGKFEVLSTFKYDTIRKFYKDWYRPDLQAVVIVGDLDINQTEKFIHKYFEKIKMPKKPKPRVIEAVPDHDEMLVTVVKDKEAMSSNLNLYYKGETRKTETYGDYRRQLTFDLFNSMFSERLMECSQKDNPPFNYAGVASFPMARSKSNFLIYSQVKDNGVIRGLETLVIETERVKRYGFTESELERAKKQIVLRYENQFKEQDKLDSSRLTRAYIRHFLTNNPMMSPEQEYLAASELINQINLKDVNQIHQELMTVRNRVIAVSLPEKEGISIPTKEELLQAYTNAQKAEISPYEESTNNIPLLKTEPVKGSIISKKHITSIDANELVLSNGMRVLYKKTDFKNNQILFDSYSPGGLSMSPLTYLPSASFSSQVIGEAGQGELDNIALGRLLKGHDLDINVRIDRNSESVNGSFSPQDTELAMQYIHSVFTQARRDTLYFKLFKTRMQDYLKYKNSDPENILNDSLQVIVNNYHKRINLLDEKTLSKIELNDSYNFYKQRFSNAGDFTFYFVGAIDSVAFESFAEKYLASLPSEKAKEKVIDHQMTYYQGKKDVKIYAGQAEKSEVRIVINSEFKNNKENNVKFRAMLFVFNEMLRETIREKLSGVYGVYAYPVIDIKPKERQATYIIMGCSPDRVEELTQAIYKLIDDLQTKPIDEKRMNVFLQTNTNTFDTNIKKNDYWLSNIVYYDSNQYNFSEFINHKDYLRKVTKEDIKDFAVKYLNYKKNLIRISLYPEKK